MPFLGTTPTQGFVGANPKQSFTANGSTTVFTLTNPVASANDLEVFVGNVRQEPTAAYTAAGTTLTMSEAPDTGLNFYVINKSQAQVTTTPPANSISTDKIVNDAVTSAKLDTNIAVAGTLAVTGNSTANSINLGGRSLGAGGTPLGVNFSSASTNGMQINDTNSGNLGGFMGFYSGSGAGTLRANIQNANNAGMHLCLGTSGTVSFGSTGYVAANALDDYEEGTWTATLGGSGSDPTVSSYSYNSGHYTKIGRQVFAHIYMRIEAGGISGGSGDGIIKGLPFAAKSTGNISNGVGGWIENYWSTSTSFSSGRNYPMLYLAAGSNYIGVWQKGTNNPTQMTGWALSQIDDAAFLVGGVLVYMTA